MRATMKFGAPAIAAVALSLPFLIPNAPAWADDVPPLPVQSSQVEGQEAEPQVSFDESTGLYTTGFSSAGIIQEQQAAIQQASPKKSPTIMLRTQSVSDTEAFKSALREAVETWGGGSTISVDCSDFSVTIEEAVRIYREFVNSNPRYFYIGGYSYSYYSSGRVASFTVRCKTQYSPTDLEEFDRVVNTFLANVGDDWTDEAKALYAHDWLVARCTYQLENAPATAFDAIVGRHAICQGYALAYKHLCSLIGLDCHVITSDLMNHAFNSVVVDGNEYLVDCTWDDPYYNLDTLWNSGLHEWLLNSKASFTSQKSVSSTHSGDDWVDEIGRDADADVSYASNYDDAFWTKVENAAMAEIGGKLAYVRKDGGSGYVPNLIVSLYNPNTKARTDLKSFSTAWPVLPDGYGYWSNSYGQLAAIRDEYLVFSTSETIEKIYLDGQSETVYTLDSNEKETGRIYGLRYDDEDAMLVYVLAQRPPYTDYQYEMRQIPFGGIEATGVDITEEDLSLETGQRQQLHFSILPVETNEQDFTFESSDGSVASVGDMGMVEAVGPGEAIITLKHARGFEDTCHITVSAPRTDISQVSVSQIEGQTYTGSAIKPLMTLSCNGATLMKGIDYTVSYKDNIQVGTAHIIISGIGAYKGSLDIPFTISARDISDATISGITAKGYDGQPQVQDISVSYNGTELLEGTDYTVSYAENTNAGNATMTITGKGNWKGSVAKSFRIERKAIGNATISGVENRIYDGESQFQQITVVAEDGTPLAASDYAVVYEDNINAGTATLHVNARGNWQGSVSTQFTISSRSISETEISGVVDKVYDGNAQTQTPTISYNGHDLVEGTDYRILYESNTQPGQAKVIISGIGNYTGETFRTFNIVEQLKSLDDATVNGISDLTYNGSPQIQSALSVSYDGQELVAGGDYDVAYKDNIQAGTATLTITGKGAYEGTVEKTFKILPASISQASVSGVEDRVFNGTAQTCDINVILDGKILSSGTDYQVEYTGNVNAGQATVTVTGKGNYTGSIAKTFTISARPLSDATISGISNKVYNGKAQTQSVSVSIDGETLDASNYTVSYKDNLNAGKASIAITGKGNWTGSVEREFTISPRNISETDISNIVGRTYTGKAQTQTPTIAYAGASLASGEYSISYENNVNAGTAKMTIAGKGNWTGTVSKSFTISARQIKDAAISNIVGKTYTGKAQTQAPSLTYNGMTLSLGSAYALSYKNNINAGTATMTITGKGNYAGSVSKSFTISARQIKDAAISNIVEKTYNGKTQTQAPKIVYNGMTLALNSSYTLSYKNNTNAGTAIMIITGKGNYTGSTFRTFKIAKAKQPMTATAAKKTVKLSQVKKKAYLLPKAITISKAQGKVSYSNTSKAAKLKKFKVNA